MTRTTKTEEHRDRGALEESLKRLRVVGEEHKGQRCIPDHSRQWKKWKIRLTHQKEALAEAAEAAEAEVEAEDMVEEDEVAEGPEATKTPITPATYPTTRTSQSPR